MDLTPQSPPRNRSVTTHDLIMDVPLSVQIRTLRPIWLWSAGWRSARSVSARFPSACWDRDRSRSELSSPALALSSKKSLSPANALRPTPTRDTGAPSPVCAFPLEAA